MSKALNPYITIAVALSAGFISSIGFGLLAPLFALRMSDLGLSSGAIGLLVTFIGAAPLFLTPYLPKVLHYIPVKKALFATIIINATLYTIALLAHEPILWTIIRIGFAITGTFLFIASESWILELAPPEKRGQIFGFYAVIFYGGIGIGGVMIAKFGYASNFNILVANALNLLVLPMFLLKTIPASKPEISGHGFWDTYKLMFLFPAIFMPAFAIGGLETAAFNLFPIWSRENGFGDVFAGLMLSAAAIGNIIFQWPLGILADRIGRKKAMILISIVAFILPIALFFAHSPNLVLLLVCIWSGFVTGFYTLGLVGVAEGFNASKIAIANATFGTTYCVGQLLAPALGGGLMEAKGADSLLISLSIIGLLPVLMFVLGRKTENLS